MSRSVMLTVSLYNIEIFPLFSRVLEKRSIFLASVLEIPAAYAYLRLILGRVLGSELFIDFGAKRFIHYHFK